MQFSRRTKLATILSTVALVAACFTPAAQAQVLEPGFVLSTYAEGFVEPIALEFAPDGRLFVAERGGTVRIVRDGVVSETVFASETVFTANENGLLGLALDPDFAENRHVYLFITIDPREQQIVRYTEVDGVGIERTVIRDHLPTQGVFHSGGCLKVGPDRKLYFSIGDNQEPDNSQDMNTLAGKIARINLDGSVPTDNPFKTPTGSPRAVYALGFRNVFRFCFAPDGRIFALDVGSDGDGRREEVNLVRAADNCGWPIVEGRQGLFADPRFVDPIFDYHDGGAAPVGCVIYSGKQFPESFRGNLFFIEYVLHRVYRLELDGDRAVRHSLFLQGDDGPLDLIEAPDGSLLYTELFSGRIRQVSYSKDDAPAPENPQLASPPAAPLLCGLGALPALLASSLLLCCMPRRFLR